LTTLASFRPGSTGRDVERIKKGFDIPLILKGIATRGRDAEIAVEHGVDCVYVSNHGRAAARSGCGVRSTYCRRVAEAGRRGGARIIIDGRHQPRHRRGQGADPRRRRGSPCGRLYVYGLAGRRLAGHGCGCFEILEDEIRICLSLLGVTGYPRARQNPTSARARPGRAAACTQRLPASEPAGARPISPGLPATATGRRAGCRSYRKSSPLK